jgi:hypothetical protein
MGSEGCSLKSEKLEPPRHLGKRFSTCDLSFPTSNTFAMPKALTFKGDKPKPKKRKRTQEEKDAKEDGLSKQLAPSSNPLEEAEHDENWVSVDNVSDLAGPVMVVFPSEPVMALACDQLGTVFASKVENMVERVASSAEPHDVRQVFVATRVVGNESDVVLKGCNGRFVLWRIQVLHTVLANSLIPDTLVATALVHSPQAAKPSLLKKPSNAYLRKPNRASSHSDRCAIHILALTSTRLHLRYAVMRTK